MRKSRKTRARADKDVRKRVGTLKKDCAGSYHYCMHQYEDQGCPAERMRWWHVQKNDEKVQPELTRNAQCGIPDGKRTSNSCI